MNRYIRKLLLCSCLFSHLAGVTYAESTSGNINADMAIKQSKDLLKNRNFKGALRTLENANLTWPGDPKILAQLAITKFTFSGTDAEGRIRGTKQSREALEHLRTAISLAPNEIDYKIMYSQLAYDLKEYEKAQPIYSELLNIENIRTDEETRYIVVNYAVSLQKTGKIEESLEEYKKSLIQTGSDPRIFWAYLGGLSFSKKYSIMKSEYDNFEKQKGFLPNVKYKLCMEYLASQKYKLAEDCYNDLLSNPKTAGHFRKRGTIDMNYLKSKISADE